MRIGSYCATLLLVLLVGTADAVDGVNEINQARALAGGVTPGDTSGFPVSIGVAGSYRLTSNLQVPTTNTTALQILTDNVTVDLNGFAIIGPNACTGCPVTTCTGGTGVGVDVTTGANVAVRNGTVRGMGLDGIRLNFRGLVDGVRADFNGGAGILSTAGGATVIDSRAHANGRQGIDIPGTAAVRGTTAECNAQEGIRVARGEVHGNTVVSNKLDGIKADSATIIGNTSSNNGQCGIRSVSAVIQNNRVAQNGFCGIDVSESGSVIGNTLHLNTRPALNLGSVGIGHNAIRTDNPNCSVFGGLEIAPNVCNGSVSQPATLYPGLANPTSVCGHCIN